MSTGRLEYAELLRRQNLCPEVGSVWRHYRGALYEVVGREVDEETLEPRVCYRLHTPEVKGLQSEKVSLTSTGAFVNFSRPLRTWNNHPTGSTGETMPVRRFTKVQDAPKPPPDPGEDRASGEVGEVQVLPVRPPDGLLAPEAERVRAATAIVLGAVEKATSPEIDSLYAAAISFLQRQFGGGK